jgi:hypothetical protein
VLKIEIEHERLPTELGWTTPDTVISRSDLSSFSDDIINATSYEALTSHR